MKMYKIISILFTSFCFIQTIIGQNNTNIDEDGIWTGTVSFLEKQTGKEIIISEWRMDAKITNNQAATVYSFKFKDAANNTTDCKVEDKAELEAGIDYDAGKYSITV